jgi:dolichyl-phosphate beta-glucosyltransferase
MVRTHPKQLSVIIPAFNEEDHITDVLTEVAEFLQNHSYKFEILVIDDGSRDQTALMVSSLKGLYPQIQLIPHELNRGKGEAVRTGIRHARYRLLLFMDADNSTRINEWEKCEGLFEKGALVVVGSRHMNDSNIVHPQPLIRRILGTGYRILCRFLFGVWVSDFNCGFKAYETELAKKVYDKVRMRDWTFDVEVFCLLKKEGISVQEIPVRWEHRHKDVRIAPLQTAVKSLKSLKLLKKRF